MALVGGSSYQRAAVDRPSRPRLPPLTTRAVGFGWMFLVHALVAGALAYGSVAFPSAWWGYAVLLTFLSMCLGLLRYSPATFLLTVPLLANRITEFISGAAIEGGAYMVETTTYGQPTGAFARLLLIYLAFFFVATITIESGWPRLRVAFADAPSRWVKQAPLIWAGLLLFAIASSLYLIRLGINNGFPLFQHIDRFVYLAKVDSPIYTAFLRNRLVAVPFVGALFAVPKYRLRALVFLVWLLATSIIFGEKFGSLLMIISVFSIPAGLVHIANDRPIPLRRVAMLSGAIVVVTIPAVLVAYGALENFAAAKQRYEQRVALQGQLWYVADNKYLAFARFDDQALAADVASWVTLDEQDSRSAGTRYGLFYVMSRFTDSRTLGYTMEGGNGFVFSLYPYLLIASGVLGVLIVSTIIAIYHALLMRFLALSFAGSNWIAAIAFGRVMSSIYGLYAGGFLYNIFGLKSLATFAFGLFILWEFGQPHSKSRKLTQALARKVQER